jgi:murein L,D-transpeptidase YcbB/YkuD
MQFDRRHFLATIMASCAALPFASTTANGQDTQSGLFGTKPRTSQTEIDGNTATARSLVDAVEPVLSLQTSANLQKAIENYDAFVQANGNWELPERDAFGLQIGKNSRAVAALKRRLMINGDMPLEKRVSNDFDTALDAGVRLFQARHGLNINGHVDEATFYALSVPADYRLRQLRLNAERVNFWASQLSDRYIVVNIPAASIEAVETSQVVQRHTAVVGKVDRATPILNSKIHQVKFNPFWTVPKSIIQKDLIRYMNEDPEYLTKFRIRIFDGKGEELAATAIDWSTNDAVNYTFRQDPGADNSLGRCKIDFYNKYDVYMHDTPLKGLFGENARFLSSGCVRAENIDTLVAWLLRDNGDWDLPGVQTAFEEGVREDVKLKVQVPIHTTYITAWANSQGTVSFRDDVYQFDAVGKVSFPETT